MFFDRVYILCALIFLVNVHFVVTSTRRWAPPPVESCSLLILQYLYLFFHLGVNVQKKPYHQWLTWRRMWPTHSASVRLDIDVQLWWSAMFSMTSCYVVFVFFPPRLLLHYAYQCDCGGIRTCSFRIFLLSLYSTLFVNSAASVESASSSTWPFNETTVSPHSCSCARDWGWIYTSAGGKEI